MPNTYTEIEKNYCTLTRHLSDIESWNVYLPPKLHELLSLYWLPTFCIKIHTVLDSSLHLINEPQNLLTSCLSVVMIHYKDLQEYRR